jgi:hypothetical protein
MRVGRGVYPMVSGGLGRAHLTYEGPTQSFGKLLRFKLGLIKFG